MFAPAATSTTSRLAFARPISDTTATKHIALKPNPYLTAARSPQMAMTSDEMSTPNPKPIASYLERMNKMETMTFMDYVVIADAVTREEN